MIRASASTVIARSPEEVYGFIADLPNNYRRWSPEVRQLQLYTSGPVRVGTMGRQVRVDQGRRTESTFRVNALEPGRRVALKGTSNPFRLAYQLTPVEGGTRLSFEFELSRLELYMRPFEKLIRRTVQEGSERTVRNIKGLVEGRGQSVAEGTDSGGPAAGLPREGRDHGTP